MKRAPSLPTLIIFAILITLPYLVAVITGGDDHIFGGFLMNPQDGNSYLAKMEEGRLGEWKFSLPFTAEKSEGAYLFLFYIFLGHIARLTGFSLVVVFHITRMIGALFLFFSLYNFTARLFSDHPKGGRQAFLLCLFGSGMGWLFLLLGLVTSDFWVVETFPFLSSYASPHFSIGIGILLWMLLDIISPALLIQLVRLTISGLLMAILMPFGIVVVGSIGFIWTISEWLTTRHLDLRPIVAAMLLGGPFLLYQFFSILQDPYLVIWNNQNLTQSPPIWDLSISLIPALFFTGFGIFQIVKSSAWNPATRLLVIWFVVGVGMIYFPFSLQRRFMFGFFIPVSCLAIMGLSMLSGKFFMAKLSNILFPTTLALSVITNCFVILLALFGIAQKSPLFYLSKDELTAYKYLISTSPPDAVILCSPETGNFIPGWTGLRVIYGHEFETIHAVENKAVVTDIYAGRISTSEISSVLKNKQVRYIFWGPRERRLGQAEFLINLKPVYKNESVEIFTW